MHSKTFLNCLLIMTMVGFLGLSALVLFFLGPGSIFRRPQDLRLGVLVERTSSEAAQRMERAVEAAVEDIHASIAKLETVGPLPPKIELLTSPSFSCSEQYSALHNEGVRYFFALCDANALAEMRHDGSDASDDASVLLTPAAVWPDRHNKERTDVKMVSTGMTLTQEARAYFALLNDTNLTGKVFYIAPVVLDNYSSQAFFEALHSELRLFPDLKFTQPVVLEASAYPKSDAFQAISELGTRISMYPNSHVLLLTSSSLTAHILDTAHVNRALRRHRWFVRVSEAGLGAGAGDLDERLSDMAPRARRYTQSVSLSTIGLLADGDGSSEVELRRYAGKAIRRMETEKKERLSIFAEAQSYETMMLIHRDFTKFQYLGRSRFLDHLHTEGPFTATNPPRRSRGVLLSFLFNNERRNISGLPTTGWISDRIMYIDQKSEEIRRAQLKTYPLYREELKRIASHSETECEEPAVSLTLPPTILSVGDIDLRVTPVSRLPFALLVPLRDGLEVSLHCPDQSTETKYIDQSQEPETQSPDQSKEPEARSPTLLARFACLPNKLDRGNITCVLSGSESGRYKREITSESLLERFSNSVLPTWRSLAPSVLSCAGSVAGCDFCLYFFTTYNVSAAHPNVCIGGCALGTVGSCTTLVGQSLVETMKMTKAMEEE